MMYPKFVAGSIIVGTMLLAGANASDNRFALPGEKLDSGLGALPHYSEWHNVPELSYLVVHEADAQEKLASAARR
jgi:hypothetical protein